MLECYRSNRAIYRKGMSFICERCGKKEMDVDYPENLHDFHFKYGYVFCEDCIDYYLRNMDEFIQDKRKF